MQVRELDTDGNENLKGSAPWEKACEPRGVSATMDEQVRELSGGKVWCCALATQRGGWQSGQMERGERRRDA